METPRTLAAYRLWAPVYDRLFGPLLARARADAIAALALRSGERLVIPGVGTGLDLPLLPAGVEVVASDLSPEMLARARAKRTAAAVTLVEGDATALALPDAAFDAALLSLVVSVVPDGAAAVREAMRVLRPGGRLVVFDKFLPESTRLGTVRRWLGMAIARLGTDPDRRLRDVLGESARHVVRDQPSLGRGRYRIVTVAKPG